MAKVMKLFIPAAALIFAAFIAIFLGFVSIPWLDVNSVATYGDDAMPADESVQKLYGE
jgi:hypothetical protein